MEDALLDGFVERRDSLAESLLGGSFIALVQGFAQAAELGRRRELLLRFRAVRVSV